MKLAFERYSGPRGYTPDQFRAVVNETAGKDLGAWMHKALDTTEELDYSPALDWYGLRFRTADRRPGAPPRVLTGITARTEGGRIVITGLRRGTPAYDAGFNVDDEILAVNGYRVRSEQWPSRLENYKPGEVTEILVARRDRLMTLKLPIVLEKPESWQLEPRPDATGEQKAHLTAWLRR
jgi:predicted metalloprotease with PDZ domain